MKTHSGSFWLDVRDSAILLVMAWVIAGATACAWWRAETGELRLFLIDAAFALLMTLAWLHEFRGTLEHTARVAIADYRIENLRRENDQLHEMADGGTP